MARKFKRKFIEKVEYCVTQMDAVEGFKTQCYIAKLITPLLSGNNSGVNLSSTLMQGLPRIIEKIAEDDKFHKFFIDTCESAMVVSENRRVSFNLDFENNLKPAYLLFFFVLEVNFSDFINDVFGVNLSQILKTSGKTI